MLRCKRSIVLKIIGCGSGTRFEACSGASVRWSRISMVVTDLAWMLELAHMYVHQCSDQMCRNDK